MEKGGEMLIQTACCSLKIDRHQHSIVQKVWINILKYQKQNMFKQS